MKFYIIALTMIFSMSIASASNNGCSSDAFEKSLRVEILRYLTMVELDPQTLTYGDANFLIGSATDVAVMSAVRCLHNKKKLIDIAQKMEVCGVSQLNKISWQRMVESKKLTQDERDFLFGAEDDLMRMANISCESYGFSYITAD